MKTLFAALIVLALAGTSRACDQVGFVGGAMIAQPCVQTAFVQQQAFVQPAFVQTAFVAQPLVSFVAAPVFTQSFVSTSFVSNRFAAVNARARGRLFGGNRQVIRSKTVIRN